MLVFYFFAAVVVWLGVMSLLSGFRYLAYVRRELARTPSDYTPRLSIFAPCRGIDDGLEENLTALIQQQYPSFEIIFVTARDDDPSIDIIESVRTRFDDSPNVTSQLVIAGEARDKGQKVHNLCEAIRHADKSSEVFVFVDSDARPGVGWLRALVSPLEDEQVGASTGYRWFIPLRGGFSSHLRSVWNASIASALGAQGKKNFCWGGSSAIRRSKFEKLNVVEHWRGAVSDDFAMTRALQSANLPIYFVPGCLTPSLDRCGLHELVEFTTRQLKITRVYASHLWKAALIGSALFGFAFFGGLGLVIVRGLMGQTFQLPVILLFVIFVLGAWKAWLRLIAVKLAIPAYERELNSSVLPHVLLWPLASALFLYNALSAGFSRRISWRGIDYELKSPTETVIMRRDDQ